MKESLRKRLLETFKLEAKEHIGFISREMINYENETDKKKKHDLLQESYRAAHSLKGAARAVNFLDIVELLQNLENLFSSLRDGEIKEESEVFTTILSTVKTVENYINSDDATRKELIDEIENENNKILDVTFNYKKSSEEIENSLAENQNIFEYELQEEVTLIDDKSSEEEVSSEEQTEPQEELPSIEEATPKVEKIKNGKDDNTSNNLASEVPKINIEDTTRISIKKLEDILLQAEELIPNKNLLEHNSRALDYLLSDFDDWINDWSEIRIKYLQILEKIETNNSQNIDGLFDVLKFLGKTENFIEEKRKNLIDFHKSHLKNKISLGQNLFKLTDSIKSSLMLPFKTLTDLFPMMVRDIANELGKKAKLNIVGDSLEVDKRILEQLKDPLVHLLRNSLDHGIETPEERSKLGKEETGLITINISQETANKLKIEIKDDGKGIDKDKLLNKAVEKGIVNDDVAKYMDEKSILNLIFESNLSTSAMITELSGRGLGMSVVKENILKLGGNIEIQSIQGEGTTFIFTIPIHISSNRGLQIIVSKQKYIILNSNIKSILRIHKDEITTVEGKNVIKFNNKTIGLLSLASILGLPIENSVGDFICVVVIKSLNTDVGLVIDGYEAENEIIVKRFNQFLKNIKFYDGAVVAADGSVIPVLKISDIINSVNIRNFKHLLETESDEISETKSDKKKIIVIDDSITSRLLLQDIITLAGYEVITANDGKEGWERIKENKIDLIVSDVEMPRMDGFQLTKKVKSDDKLKDIPVILVTSLAKEEDKAKGIEAGANAYIVKSEFEQGNLLNIIENLL